MIYIHSMENKDKLESFLNEVFSSNEFMSALLESAADNFNYIDITIKIYNVLNYYLLKKEEKSKVISEYRSLFVILPYETEICRYRTICTNYRFRLYQFG